MGKEFYLLFEVWPLVSGQSRIFFVDIYENMADMYTEKKRREEIAAERKNSDYYYVHRTLKVEV